MQKLTKQEANYAYYPFDKFGPVARRLKKRYPCAKCAHWEGERGEAALKTISTCDLVQGQIRDKDNCFYWSLIGIRPNIKPIAKLMRVVVPKED